MDVKLNLFVAPTSRAIRFKYFVLDSDVDDRTAALTEYPDCNNWETQCNPIYPLAPVTQIVFVGVVAASATANAGDTRELEAMVEVAIIDDTVVSRKSRRLVNGEEEEVFVVDDDDEGCSINRAFASKSIHDDDNRIQISARRLFVEPDCAIFIFE